MNGAKSSLWHCMGMAQNQAFGTESVNVQNNKVQLFHQCNKHIGC